MKFLSSRRRRRMERIRKFGPSSERLTTDQVELLTLEPVVTAQEVPAEVAGPEPVKRPETQTRKAPVREALRRQKSVGLLKEIQAAIESAHADALPQSALGKACAYALGQWTRLARYAEVGNGIVEIDNNWAENAMRGVALGRKNWLHVGSEEAGPKMAAIYSVVEPCKRLEIDPRGYLEAALPGLGAVTTSRVPDLTPMAWKQARSQPTA